MLFYYFLLTLITHLSEPQLDCNYDTPIFSNLNLPEQFSTSNSTRNWPQTHNCPTADIKFPNTVSSHCHISLPNYPPRMLWCIWVDYYKYIKLNMPIRHKTRTSKIFLLLLTRPHHELLYTAHCFNNYISTHDICVYTILQVNYYRATYTEQTNHHYPHSKRHEFRGQFSATPSNSKHYKHDHNATNTAYQSSTGFSSIVTVLTYLRTEFPLAPCICCTHSSSKNYTTSCGAPLLIIGATPAVACPARHLDTTLTETASELSSSMRPNVSSAENPSRSLQARYTDFNTHIVHTFHAVRLLPQPFITPDFPCGQA